MVIKVKTSKNSIEIKCDPIVPAEFKYKFLEELGRLYILKVNDRDVFTKVENSKFTDEEKKEYLKFYEQNHFKYSFEEFLKLTTFPVGTLEVTSKEKNEKIAFIDFIPDGDVNLIWIDVYSVEYQDYLLELIKGLIQK